MAYHTGVYRDIQPFLKDKLIWSNNKGFEVWQWQGRWYLVFRNLKISELVSGKKSFEKNYKSSFDYWIEKVKKKDFDKIKRIKDKITLLEEDVLKIESVWVSDGS